MAAYTLDGGNISNHYNDIAAVRGFVVGSCSPAQRHDGIVRKGASFDAFCFLQTLPPGGMVIFINVAAGPAPDLMQ
jgi:hypothetical protein